MKRIAILSNGPGIDLYPTPFREEDFAEVIAVNWTIRGRRATWWCIRDWDAVAKSYPILHAPTICCPGYVLRQLPVKDPDNWQWFRSLPHLLECDVTNSLPKGLALPENQEKWCPYSGLLAIGLAYHLKAEQIVIYGAPMEGNDDHSGFRGGQRNADRWAHERAIYQALTNAIRDAGVDIVRILP